LEQLDILLIDAKKLMRLTEKAVDKERPNQDNREFYYSGLCEIVVYVYMMDFHNIDIDTDAVREKISNDMLEAYDLIEYVIDLYSDGKLRDVLRLIDAALS
jgi:hypothetical protein